MNGTVIPEEKYKLIKDLSNEIERLKKEEKDYNHESPQKYLETRRKRKKVEKQLFQLIRDI